MLNAEKLGDGLGNLAYSGLDKNRKLDLVVSLLRSIKLISNSTLAVIHGLPTVVTIQQRKERAREEHRGP